MSLAYAKLTPMLVRGHATSVVELTPTRHRASCENCDWQEEHDNAKTAEYRSGRHAEETSWKERAAVPLTGAFFALVAAAWITWVVVDVSSSDSGDGAPSYCHHGPRTSQQDDFCADYYNRDAQYEP